MARGKSKNNKSESKKSGIELFLEALLCSCGKKKSRRRERYCPSRNNATSSEQNNSDVRKAGKPEDENNQIVRDTVSKEAVTSATDKMCLSPPSTGTDNVRRFSPGKGTSKAKHTESVCDFEPKCWQPEAASATHAKMTKFHFGECEEAESATGVEKVTKLVVMVESDQEFQSEETSPSVTDLRTDAVEEFELMEAIISAEFDLGLNEAKDSSPLTTDIEQSPSDPFRTDSVLEFELLESIINAEFELKLDEDSMEGTHIYSVLDHKPRDAATSVLYSHTPNADPTTDIGNLIHCVELEEGQYLLEAEPREATMLPTILESSQEYESSGSSSTSSATIIATDLEIESEDPVRLTTDDRDQEFEPESECEHSSRDPFRTDSVLEFELLESIINAEFELELDEDSMEGTHIYSVQDHKPRDAATSVLYRHTPNADPTSDIGNLIHCVELEAGQYLLEAEPREATMLPTILESSQEYESSGSSSTSVPTIIATNLEIESEDPVRLTTDDRDQEFEPESECEHSPRDPFRTDSVLEFELLESIINAEFQLELNKDSVEGTLRYSVQDLKSRETAVDLTGPTTAIGNRSIVPNPDQEFEPEDFRDSITHIDPFQPFFTSITRSDAQPEEAVTLTVHTDSVMEPVEPVQDFDPEHGHYHDFEPEEDCIQSFGSQEDHIQNCEPKDDPIYNLEPQETFKLQEDSIQNFELQEDRVQNFEPQDDAIHNFDPEEDPIQNAEPQEDPIQNCESQEDPVQNFEPQDHIQDFQPEDPIQYETEEDRVQHFEPWAHFYDFEPKGEHTEEFEPGYRILDFRPKGDASRDFDPEENSIREFQPDGDRIQDIEPEELTVVQSPSQTRSVQADDRKDAAPSGVHIGVIQQSKPGDVTKPVVFIEFSQDWELENVEDEDVTPSTIHIDFTKDFQGKTWTGSAPEVGLLRQGTLREATRFAPQLHFAHGYDTNAALCPVNIEYEPDQVQSSVEFQDDEATGTVHPAESIQATTSDTHFKAILEDEPNETENVAASLEHTADDHDVYNDMAVLDHDQDSETVVIDFRCFREFELNNVSRQNLAKYGDERDGNNSADCDLVDDDVGWYIHLRQA